MQATLEALPVELVAHIATFLDFQPVLNLRLTSRTLAAKLSAQLLARFFAYKNVELAEEPLQDLVYMTSQGRAGCLLQHCTITGVADTDKGRESDSEKPVLLRLLTAAFVNLKQHCPHSRLVSLCLGIDLRVECHETDKHSDDSISEPDYGRSQRFICRTARRTFDITMAALCGSQLPVTEHFDLFGGVQGPGLHYEAFLPPNKQFAPTTVFSSLKKLTMHLSSEHRFPDRLTLDAIPAADYDQSTHGTQLLQGLLVMLASVPKLEDLDVHWYNIGGISSISLEDRTIDLDVSAHLGFTRLKTCGLRGLYVSGSDLLTYLKATRPTTLTMTDIRLAPEAWSLVFDYLSSPDSPIASYHLDDLREGVYLVHFDVPGQSKFPYRGVQMGPSTLTRRAHEVNEAIRYRVTSRRPLGSGARMRWLNSKRLEFGPPGMSEARSQNGNYNE